MNRSFENIFEKYNITCEVPRKRHKSTKPFTQSHKFPKNYLNLDKGSIMQKNGSASLISSSIPNTEKSLNLTSTYYWNNKMKGKYFNPTRYKTLDVVGVESVYKHLNNSSTESSPISSGVCGKENCNEQISASSENGACKKIDYETNCVKFGRNINVNKIKFTKNSKTYIGTDSTNKILSSNLNTRENYNENVQSLSNQQNFNTSFEKQSISKCGNFNNSDFFTESFEHFDSSFPKSCKTKDNLVKQQVDGTVTELDLLIDLIEQDEQNNKKVKEYKKNKKFFNCDENLRWNKSSLKGGYEELFLRALKHEKVKSNFLKYDKKVGLRTGQLLTVVAIEASYGLTLAMVKSEVLNKSFAVAVTQEMAQRLKLGSQIEAFFDDKTLSYKLELNGECLDIYLEPYKLLTV